MENIIRELLIAAQGLDNRGLSNEANELDKTAETLVKIKTAQYDGTQGYFIRNTRCWNGCIRTKRAEGKNPNEAWTECHEEWVDSSTSGSADAVWGKYANDESFNKTAGIYDNIILTAADAALKNIIEGRISQGMSYEDAIPMSLAERSIALASELSKCAEKINILAEGLDIEGSASVLKDVSIKLSELSAEEYVKSISF